MTRPTHDWIPERHLGVAATLSHADDLIGQIGDLLFDYQVQPGGTFTLRELPAGSVSRTEVVHVAPIPRKVSLLVADALVALRAALEHALFAEVEFLEGGQLNERAAKLVEIPASETYIKFTEWVRKRAKNGPPSLRTGGELVRRIEGLQPFQLYKEPHSHPLARLTLHTNHAKHRTPAVMAVRLAAMYRDDQLPRSIRDLPARPEEPLRVGDVVAETPLGTKVPVTLFPTVGINRPGTDRWPVLMTELDEISTWVRTQAVPRLITGGDPPESGLPTRYEISVGQEDERAAIAAGSMISALERHKQRLSAATVRRGLVDLIGQSKDDALSVADIEAWAGQLTDEEVLERMSRLRMLFTYDPDILQQNAEAVTGLRNEVMSFALDNDPPKAR
ncbi:hypothetical protein ACH4MU_29905 [Streptomyces albidoflavus]|uniref:Uncharacterized protein n=1 Tax=Streptomyces wadayamensis TaxID=141454 RepID=A0ABR4S5M8_9ACTN|nr:MULTISPECIES: hypothetical protein [Streptomyces]KDR60942.1 hypothetical protein DC60_02865 [Streptomyces wadayamensis]QXQ25861.1 hypothetical protein STALF2_14610 [Streptomyces albidoflavus]QXQ31790.1 hypothetical protein STALF4_14660 [Streptomyces albidoflavus]